MCEAVKLESNLTPKTLLNEKILNTLICFITYSFIGWIVETVYMSIYHGHIVKRGFLLGPLCVVYGICSLIVILILNRLKSHPFLLFLSAAVLTSAIELLAGIFLKELMNKCLWDYTGNFASFMGFICLRNSLIWGVLSLFFVYFIHPTILRFLTYLPLKIKEITFFIIVLYMPLDIAISVYTSLKGVNNLVWISQVFMHRMP